MSYEFRYPLDPTGLNSDNLVIGEVHTLSASSIRIAAPRYGTFFAQNLEVYDDITGIKLIFGTQYTLTSLANEASLKFGKELYLLIAITDTNVSNRIRINYQALGGYYQNTASGIINMYETLLNDNRSVEWANVLNAPDRYPPTLHQHIMADIYQFGPLVNSIERLRQAILLGDTPAIAHLVDWVEDKFNQLPIATLDDVRSGIPSSKLITTRTLNYMLLRYQQYPIYAATFGYVAKESDVDYALYIQVDTSANASNKPVYWTVSEKTSTGIIFSDTSGFVSVADNKATIAIHYQSPNALNAEFLFKLYVDDTYQVDVNSGDSIFKITGEYVADYSNELYRPCGYQLFQSEVTPERLFINLSADYGNQGKGFSPL